MLDRPWTTDRDEVVAAQFLDWLAAVHDGGLDVPVSEFLRTQDASGDEDALLRIFADLKSAGWIQDEQSVGGGGLSAGSRLSDAGRARQRRLSRAREDGTARDVACEEALLDWLVNWVRDHLDSGATWNPFINDPRGHIWGEPFSEKEVKRAASNLRNSELISGIVSNEADSLFRAKPTSRGIEAARRTSGHYPSSASEPATVTYTQNFQGTVSGQVVQGANANLVQNVGVQPEQLDELLGAVRALVGSLPVDQQGPAAIWIDAIAEESSTSADQAALVTFSERLKSVAGRGGSVAFTSAVTLLVKALAGEVGL